MMNTAMDNPSLFKDRHAPSVRVIMGLSLNSLQYHQSEDDEVVNASVVYNSQDSALHNDFIEGMSSLMKPRA